MNEEMSIEKLQEKLDRFSQEESPIVQPFGFCRKCNDVTPYKDESPVGSTVIRCLRCNEMFGGVSFAQFEDLSEYAFGDDVPKQHRDDVDQRHGRNFQLVWMTREIRSALMEISRRERELAYQREEVTKLNRAVVGLMQS